MFGENRDAAAQLIEKYDQELMEKIALALFKHHRSQQIIYQFDEDAESLYKTIFDKYNAQFNLKYSGKIFMQLLLIINKLWRFQSNK